MTTMIVALSMIVFALLGLALHLIHYAYMAIAIFTATSLTAYGTMITQMIPRILASIYINHLLMEQIKDYSHIELTLDQRQQVYISLLSVGLYLYDYVAHWDRAYRRAVSS